MRRAVSWCRRMGRRPVVVEKEIDGFIVNRVLGAASQEAFSLLTEGIASVADIDTAARAGLNWPMGPFELADFSGVDVVLGVRRDRRTRDGGRGGETTLRLLESMVAAGRLGRKAGRGFYDYSTKPPTPLPLPET
jgi:3-hydroxybutyryl-CoA dehydrogenase